MGGTAGKKKSSPTVGPDASGVLASSVLTLGPKVDLANTGLNIGDPWSSLGLKFRLSNIEKVIHCKTKDSLWLVLRGAVYRLKTCVFSESSKKGACY